jgi:DNA mismatch endonuclease (patch repair protein)
MSDRLSPAARSENMRRIRSKDTGPELAVRRLIHRLGYRYRLHVNSLPGKPDIVLVRHKKIVEVRGCFWHKHRGCKDAHLPKSRQEYWAPKLARNVQRDKRNHEALKQQGWNVLVIWECETQCWITLRSHLIEFLSS